MAMEMFLDKLFEFLGATVEKFGTKFLVTLGIEGGIAYLIYCDKIPGLWGAIIMGIVAICYFAFRRKQEKETIS